MSAIGAFVSRVVRMWSDGFQYAGFGVRSSGQYEGAQARRRLKHWQPGEESMISLLAGDGRLLRRRARDLMRNNPIISSAVESYVANLIGAGIKPSPIQEKATKALIQEAWREWTDECDAANRTDFYGLQALVARSMIEAGEVFIRFRNRRADEGFRVPLQIEILESEMVPYERNQTAPTGNRIINGIEFDLRGRRMAYWFYRQHPGDIKIFGMNTLVVRVPAEQVLHIFRPLRPGQVRGVPWCHPSMVRAYMLDAYDDAELDRKKTAALFAGFITSPEVESRPEGEDDDSTVTLEPATMQQLLPGETVNFSQPTDVGGSYEAFQYRNLLTITSGLGVPYMNVTGDISKANYSSLRGGLVEYRRRLEQIQHGVIVHQMCRGVLNRWMDDAVLAGRLELPDYLGQQKLYQKMRWITPRNEWVDPLKDVEADKVAVDNLFKSRSDVIESMGEDPEDTDSRIAADQEREESLGLKRVLKTGAAVDPEAQDASASKQPGGDGQDDQGGGQDTRNASDDEDDNAEAA